jgi:hypothetical protein
MTVPTQKYAASTVAMTAYNLVRLKNKPTTADELFDDVRQIQHPLCDRKLFDQAMKVLVEDKGFIHGRDGFYWLKDQKRRQVVSRNITDAEIDEKTGEIRGGWEGWTVLDNARGPLAITEVVK